MRRTRKALGVMGVLALSTLAACDRGDTFTSSGDGSEAASQAAADVVATADPAAAEWSEEDAVTISLDGDAIAADAGSVSVDGTTVTITAAGTYRLSGSLTDGQVVVDTDDDGAVQLVLDGADIESSTTAAIWIVEADTVVVVLADGTENHLSDGSTASAAAGEDDPTATLFSTADLTIAGAGSLTVEGNVNDGISSKDGLVVVGGTIAVDAVDDGIRGQDYVIVEGGAITVSAGGDGLKSDNEEDATLGYVAVAGGTLDVTAGADAIQAQTDATISGGLLTMSATDDALHADGSITISGGTVDVVGSYEGLESATITIGAGDITIVAGDDGINVAGGNDASGQQGPGGAPAGDAFDSTNGQSLTISGGTVLVDADGDGIDVNGSFSMTGGTVVVHGPTGDGNGALDVDGTFDVSGGLLVAAGSAGMAEAPDESSAQASVAVLFTSPQEAGTLVHIQDADGATVVTFEPSKAIQSIVVSSPDLVAGATYEVLVGGRASGEEVGGLLQGGTYTPGTDVGSVTARG